MYHSLWQISHVTILEDGTVTLVHRRLADAVDALAEETPIWEHGSVRMLGTLYDRVRRELTGGRNGVRGRRAPGSRVPLRADVLNWLTEVDQTARVWEPGGKGTVDRLHALRGRQWGPDQTGEMTRRARVLERWAQAAIDLIEHSPVLHLPFPCPACGAHWARRRDTGGDLVRTRPLRVSESGCTCTACGAGWPPEQLEFLARLLGCEPVTA
jgi:hypothetical protein